jgi:hypothetical protein
MRTERNAKIIGLTPFSERNAKIIGLTPFLKEMLK